MFGFQDTNIMNTEGHVKYLLKNIFVHFGKFFIVANQQKDEF